MFSCLQLQLQFLLPVVRHYKKETNKSNYSETLLDETVAVYQRGKMSEQRVARQIAIPKSTLHDHITGLSSRKGPGRHPYFAKDVDREIALTCITLQEAGFPFLQEMLFLQQSVGFCRKS